jgi:hypothetical protein
MHQRLDRRVERILQPAPDTQSLRVDRADAGDERVVGGDRRAQRGRGSQQRRVVLGQ